MNPSAVLRQINGLIDKAERDAIDDLESWREQGAACIRAAYDDSAKELQFNHIRFYPHTPDLFGPPPSASEQADAEQDGIQRSIAQLEGAKVFLRLQLPDGEIAPTEHASSIDSTVKSASLRTRIERHIEAAQDVRPDSLVEWREPARLYLQQIYGEGTPTMDRFDAIRWSSGSVSAPMTPAGLTGVFQAPPATSSRLNPGLRQAVAMLKTGLESLELDANVSPDEQQVGGVVLHPLVVKAAGELIKNGHFDVATSLAATAIENELKSLLEVDGKAFALVGQAFSADPPEPGKSRLRFSQYAPGTDDWKNAHLGAMHFGQGCFMRIRNLYAHGQKVEQREASEALAAISLLARWIDQANVDQAHEES